MLSCHALSLDQRLHDIDGEWHTGQVTAILGRNGAGKSSLLHLLAGLLTPSRGCVTLRQRPLNAYSPATLAQHRALMLQDATPILGLTVTEVLETATFAKHRPPTPQQIERVLTELDLYPHRQRPHQHLSGGERAKVAFAHAVLQLRCSDATPRYLLLDEPCAALDLAAQEQLLQYCQQLAQQEQIGVVMVLHDLNQAMRYADEVGVLQNGRLVAYGPPQRCLTASQIHAIWQQEVVLLPHPQPPHRPIIVPIQTLSA